MKKILSVLVVGILVLSGCGSNDFDQDDAPQTENTAPTSADAVTSSTLNVEASDQTMYDSVSQQGVYFEGKKGAITLTVGTSIPEGTYSIETKNGLSNYTIDGTMTSITGPTSATFKAGDTVYIPQNDVLRLTLQK